MHAVQLSIVGAASLRCGVPVIASLANYFGERPLDVVLFDADTERLDLFDRFARFVFAGMHSSHTLRSTEDPVEALAEAELVILQIDDNCARKMLGAQSARDPITCAILEIGPAIPVGASVLNLVPVATVPGRGVRDLDWPPPITIQEARSLPHRMLRCLNLEDSPYPFLKEQAHSPVVSWLNEAECGLV